MKKAWTEKEIALLKKEYPDTPGSILAKKLGRSVFSVYGKANALNLLKSESFMASQFSGRIKKGYSHSTKSQFKKGNKPWNTGVKGVCKANAGSFKKGQKPHNHKPVGSTRINEEKYHIIKTAEPNKWELLHRHNWKKVHGKIPNNKLLIFKDGNKNNCAVKNLLLITKKENMQNNTIHRYSEEIKDVIKVVSKLKKTIKNHAKK
jgi:hypothetical protein